MDTYKPAHPTINRVWQYLGADTEDIEQLYCHLMKWPPDVFALCAAVLQKSGAYIPTMDFLTTNKSVMKMRATERREAGQKWRKSLDDCFDKSEKQPEDGAWGNVGGIGSFEQNLRRILDAKDKELFQIADNRELCDALMNLLTISDEASVGIGLPVKGRKTGTGAYYRATEEQLFPKQFGSSLCRIVHPSVARVLPKLHTSQWGLTLRSFSHHLSYCESDEVRPSWISVPGSRGNPKDIYRVNILVAPWPLEMFPSQVSEVQARGVPYNEFTVTLKSSGGEIARRLSALADEACRIAGPIDIVCLPELSMTTQDYWYVRSELLHKKIMIIAGVGSNRQASNYLNIDIPISASHALRLRQRKHHRWKLDESQIHQYHLGSRLRPDKMYWERIDVQDRQVRFVVLRPWLVATGLICEDLARHEPVGDVIKGVGPNMVVALLMDGPQLANRWPGRYAAVLADDPGCSVLTLSSLGMTELSRPRNVASRERSRVIGLWKDAFSGVATEIELQPNYHGVVLTLSMRRREEMTADGRSDDRLASFPNLSGVNQVKVPNDLPVLRSREPQWLSTSDARYLAELAQAPVSPEIMPPGLNSLEGTAFRIGREIWRLRAKRPRPHVTGLNKYDLKISGGWASEEEAATAREIENWHKTNRDPKHKNP